MMKSPRMHKKREMKYFDKLALHDKITLINRPKSMGLFWGFLHGFALRKSVELSNFPLDGKKIANVCCGAGMEAEYYSRLKAKVVGFDISKEQIKCAAIRNKEHHSDIDLVVADAEYLPVKSRSFDIALVYEGLHHLANPHKGVFEMARASSKALILCEGTNAFITRFLIHFGIVEKFENSGTNPYRFTRTEIYELLRKWGFRRIKFYRYFFHCPKVLDRFKYNKIVFALFKVIFYALNTFLGCIGNRSIIIACR